MASTGRSIPRELQRIPTAASEDNEEFFDNLHLPLRAGLQVHLSEFIIFILAKAALVMQGIR